MKRKHVITFVCVVIMILLVHGAKYLAIMNSTEKHIKVGFVYVGDSCDAYTNNFIRAQKAIEKEYGTSVEVIAKYNVLEGAEEVYLRDLIKQGCNLIFTTSYGYGETAKKLAAEYPDIEFCAATCANANEEPRLENLHNFMGEIYQGRYVSGIVAGMKLQELIEAGSITKEQAKIGYVAAFPYAEVISGYTAFYLGVAEVVPEVTMSVVYTDSWGDYDKEKEVASYLIEEGCTIISQHSDTAGPAIACEEATGQKIVYHVGYNQSMADVAPTTSLISSRINWQEYMVAATGAVLKDKKIESYVKGNVHGNDISGGFKEGWVQMLKLNETIAAKGTQDKMNQIIQQLQNKKISVFKGNYTGTDPFDKNDQIDLSTEYIENEFTSSPSFHYILNGVITIEEY